MIINLHAYWNAINSVPFLRTVIPIMNSDNQTLALLVRSEIIAHRTSIAGANADIKSIKHDSSVENFVCFISHLQ